MLRTALDQVAQILGAFWATCSRALHLAHTPPPAQKFSQCNAEESNRPTMQAKSFRQRRQWSATQQSGCNLWRRASSTCETGPARGAGHRHGDWQSQWWYPAPCCL